MPKKKRDDRKATDLTTDEAVERLFHPDMADALREATTEADDPTPDKPRRKPTKGT